MKKKNKKKITNEKIHVLFKHNLNMLTMILIRILNFYQFKVKGKAFGWWRHKVLQISGIVLFQDLQRIIA